MFCGSITAAHIITPLQMLYFELLCCCCSSHSISNMMRGVMNYFFCFWGGFLYGAFSSCLHNFLCQVANIFWIVFGILFLWANGISRPLLLFFVVVFFCCIPHLPFNCLFVMGLANVYASSPPRLFWCIRLCMPWCKMPLLRLLLLMSWRVWLCVWCWELRRCFVIYLLRWIKRSAHLIDSWSSVH